MTHYNRESFEQALSKGELMMVDFWAEWCGPCQMLGPVIEDLAERYAGRAAVGKVNVDEEPELAVRSGVATIPPVVFFQNRQGDRPGGWSYAPGGFYGDSGQKRMM